MRLELLALSSAFFVASGCTLWDPDFEPDPDESLRDLIAPTTNAESMDAVARERLRFAVERLATRHPGHVPSQIAAGALAIESGEPQRAQGYVDRALSQEPANVEARCLRIRIAIADGSLELAQKLVEDGLRLRPDAPELYESSAWVSELSGHPEAALRALDAAESLSAPSWRVAYHRGLIEELRGNGDAAEKHYRSAIAANDACAQARQRLAGLAAKRILVQGR